MQVIMRLIISLKVTQQQKVHSMFTFSHLDPLPRIDQRVFKSSFTSSNSEFQCSYSDVKEEGDHPGVACRGKVLEAMVAEELR